MLGSVGVFLSQTFGYTESQIIPNTSKKASNSGIS